MTDDQFIYSPHDTKSAASNRLVVLSDLIDFKAELIDEIKRLIKVLSGQPGKRYLKSHELSKMLGMSASTLQVLRNNGTLPFAKLGGVLYYDMEDITRLLSTKQL